MRIGIGKSFGSVHIGTSVSTKGITKWLWYFIAWPFYLMYYMCVWPFVAIYRAVTKKKKINKAVATAEATRYLEILQDSAKICAETKNPETFFSRMRLLEETMDKLIEYENVIHFTGQTPSEAKKEFFDSKVETINNFIDRYARETRIKIYELKSKNGKINRVNAFYNILKEYADEIPAECMEKIREITAQLNDLAEQSYN